MIHWVNPCHFNIYNESLYNHIYRFVLHCHVIDNLNNLANQAFLGFCVCFQSGGTSVTDTIYEFMTSTDILSPEYVRN